MTNIRLIDEINRLFDEMVRDPWARPLPAPGKIKRPDATHLDVEMPLGGHQRGDVFVAVEGQQLTVTLRRRKAEATGSGATAVTAKAQEELQRTFTLPEDADVAGIEAHFEDEVLRIRIRLRNPIRR